MGRRAAWRWDVRVWGLVVPCASAGLLLLLLSARLEPPPQVFPSSQWWQGVLVNLGTTLLGFAIAAVYIDRVVAVERARRWRTARAAQALAALDLLAATLQALGAVCNRPEWRERVTAAVNTDTPPDTLLPRLAEQWAPLEQLLKTDIPAILAILITDDERRGPVRLQYLAEAESLLLARLHDVLLVGGDQLGPAVLANLLRIRRGLRGLQDHLTGAPQDAPEQWGTWRAEGAAMWMAVTAALAALLRALTDDE